MADGGNKRSIKGSSETRSFRLEKSADGQRYPAALSSEIVLDRIYGAEVLSHKREAVNLERCADGLVLLYNHDINEPIGRVDNVRLDGDRLRGDLTFSKRAKAQEVKQDVDDGMLRDISVRYSIDDYEETRKPDGILITRWTVQEASIVTVPADHTVGIGRSRNPGSSTQKETVMSDDMETGCAGKETAGTPTVTQLSGKRKADEERGAARARKLEAERTEQLLDLFDTIDARFHGPDFDSLQRECLRDQKCDLNKARGLILDLIQKGTAEQTPSTRSVADDQNGGSRSRDPFIQAGADGGDKMAQGITRSIEARSGLLSSDEMAKDGANEFRGRRLADLARSIAIRQGLRVSGLNDYQMLGVVLSQGGRRDISSGTEDFTGILANVSNKSLLKGWETANTTYRQWVRIGNLSDFKRANRTALSGMNLLDEVPENGEYKYGKPADRTEYITALKYGKLFSISREALINDDLSAFTAIPMNMGRAADLTVNKAVYDSLCSQSGTGPTLNQTGRALFNSTDGNYTATSGTPAVSTLEVGRSAMARQLDPTNSMPLNIQPKYLLVPSALSSTAKILVASEKDPLGLTSATGGATVPNPFYNQLTVITEAYLDDTSHTNGTVAWYLIADQNTTDTYEVGFLNGQQTPYMESKNGWDVDGVEYKVRIEAGVAALDFRGMYRKKGA